MHGLSCLRIALFFEILSLLSPVISRAEAGVFLHLSRIGDSPSRVSITFKPGDEKLSLEVAQNHIAPGIKVPSGAFSAIIESSPLDPGEKPGEVLNLRIPSEGRFLLLLWKEKKGESKFSLISADSVSLPKGGVSHLNLTSSNARCFLDAESVEIPPGTARLHPAVSLSRRVVNHRVQLEAKGKWEPANSSAMVLGANRRCIIVIYESPDGLSVHSATVTDYSPDITMALDLPKTPAVRAEPPLPDPPAK